MACPGENELLEYADGLLDSRRSAGVIEHVHACDACRRVLAAIAVSDPADTVADAIAIGTAARSVAADGGPEDLPADLLDRYLLKDARQREMTASWLLLIISVLGTAAGLLQPHLVLRLPVFALVLQPLVIVCETVLLLRMRRGWFHPAVPFASSLVEVSLGFMMLLSVAISNPAEALTSPFHLLNAGIVLFTAIRADPRISIAAGALAAVQQIALYLFVRGRCPDYAVAAVHFPGAAIRAVVTFSCGVGGAILARHFVRRSHEALREIRTQDMFGKYVLHERVGGGGMGEVFRATYCPEGGFVRTVAVKRMKPEVSDDADFARAFRREAELCARLTHPNLVQVLDCGRFRGTFVFVMEFVDGVSLARLLQAPGQPLPARAVAYLGAEIAAGLAYVHARLDPNGQSLGLVHLDLNPPNVMISAIGEVKIADFGVARVGHGHATEGFSGKMRYAAPEQLRGDAVDARADLYALGLTLHEALTGRRVFARADDTAITASVPRLDELAPHVPRGLVDIVMSLVAEDVAARPKSASEVRDALVALGGDAAPYPAGPLVLADAVRRLTARENSRVIEDLGVTLTEAPPR